MRVKRIILIALLAMAIIFVGVKIYKGFVRTQEALSEHMPSNNVFTYAYLFSPKCLDSMEVIENYQSRFRSPITLLSYGKKYHLLAYKFDSVQISSLLTDLKIKRENSSPSSGVAYSTIGKDINYKFEYKGGQASSSKELVVYLSADSIKNTRATDSIVIYTFLLKNLSIRHSNNDDVDIFIEREGNFATQKATQMSIAFVKKGDFVYLFVLSAIQNDTKLPDNLLSGVLIE